MFRRTACRFGKNQHHVPVRRRRVSGKISYGSPFGTAPLQLRLHPDLRPCHANSPTARGETIPCLALELYAIDSRNTGGQDPVKAPAKRATSDPSLAQKCRLQDFLTPLSETGRTRVLRSSWFCAAEAVVHGGMYVHQALGGFFARTELD